MDSWSTPGFARHLAVTRDHTVSGPAYHSNVQQMHASFAEQQDSVCSAGSRKVYPADYQRITKGLLPAPFARESPGLDQYRAYRYRISRELPMRDMQHFSQQSRADSEEIFLFSSGVTVHGGYGSA